MLLLPSMKGLLNLGTLFVDPRVPLKLRFSCSQIYICLFFFAASQSTKETDGYQGTSGGYREPEANDEISREKFSTSN